MRGGYTSFDTLSLEWGDSNPEAAPAPLAPLPVLARVPEVNARPPAASETDVKAAKPNSQGGFPGGLSAAASVIEVHSVEALAPPTLSATAPPAPTPRPQTPPPPIFPKPTEPGEEPRPSELPETDLDRPSVDDPLEEPSGVGVDRGIRIDSPAVKAEPARSVGRLESADDDRWITALLRAEAAVAPYSQVIVLLTLLAAAGLTVLLLRGDASRFDTGTPTHASEPAKPAYAQTTSTAAAEAALPAEPSVAPPEASQFAVRATGPIGVRRPPVAAEPGSNTPPVARLSRIQPAGERTK